MKVKVTDENLGLHRLIEVMKHMLAARMDLGDPAFVDGIANVVAICSQSLMPKQYRTKYRTTRRSHQKITSIRKWLM